MSDAQPSPNEVNTKVREAFCPRCGYNFEGIVSTRTSSSPVDGQCSECGFTFKWNDLFEGLLLPRWFVESGKGVLGGFLRFPSTLVFLFIPWVFWKKVRIEACPKPIHVRSYIGWVLGLLLLAYLSFGTALGAIAATKSMQAADARGESFWLTWTPADQKYWAKKTKQPAILDAGKVFVAGVIDPFGVFNRIGGVPREWLNRQYRSLLPRYRPRTPFWWQGSTGVNPARISQVGIGLINLGVFALVLPLVFLVLPMTRKQAKVGFGHILRLFLLSLLGLLTAWVLSCFAWANELLGFLPWSVQSVYGYSILISLILLIVWWGWGCGSYLRLSRWPMVLISISLISLLSGPIIFAVISTIVQTILS